MLQIHVIFNSVCYLTNLVAVKMTELRGIVLTLHGRSEEEWLVLSDT